MFASVKSHMSSKRRQKISVGIFVAIAITITGLFAWQSVKAAPVVYNFGYTGTAQTFTAPEDGEYTFEAWGASGGYGYQNATTRAGGKGAYTSGKTYLSKGDTIYVYVGGTGANAKSCGQYCGGAGGWNGGAKGGDDTNHDSQPDAAGGGGGATDFRLDTTPHSRVMVAGAGAGGSYSFLGRPGNALSGDGSTQISGHSFGIGQPGKANTSGSGGGAGGYWGGTSDQVDAGQGYGGSSFVSGHPGAVALRSGSSTAPRLASDGETVCTPALATTDASCSEHYSGSLFFNSTVLSGSQTFLSPAGASVAGHTGNGYARITGEFYTDETDQPVINSVSPNTSATSGGQQVTIYGDNFEYIGTPANDGTEKTAKVLIGGAECTNVVFNGDSLTCTTSANASGAADIVIYNGKRSATKSGLFEYDTPIVGSVTPSSGPTAGGQEITIPVTGISASTIPSTYTPIEYLNFTGTQYINTGVTQINNPKITVDFQPNATGQVAYSTIFGSAGTNAQPYPSSSLLRISPDGIFIYVYNGNSDNAHTSVGAGFTANSGSRSIFEMSQTGEEIQINLDGDSRTLQQRAVISSYARPYFIGMSNFGGTASTAQAYRGKIFSTQMHENGLLVRNFQPARRNSDNVLGLYDKVTGAFYPNNGTGAFGAGPVLPSNTHFSNVTVGGKVCANATYENDKITCTTSSHVKGVVDVVLDNGLDKVTVKDGYEYTMSANAISPSVGSVEGGQKITITGLNLQAPDIGYTAIDYLNFTGTQYINSGITQVNNPKITVDFQPNATGQNQYANIFGVYGSNANPYPSGSGLRVNNNTAFQYNYNRLEDNVHTGVIVGSNSGARSSFEMVQNGQTVDLTFDGEKYTASQRIPTTARVYFIGAPNNGGTVNTNQSYRGRIYSMQMYENGSIVRDFQPARRNSDNVLGMYDKLNKVFYGNNGTGTFGAGAVKPDAYLGTVKLGNSICTDPTIVSDGTITCTSGSSEPGVFDVTVDNTVDSVTLTDSYEYLVDNYLKTLTSSEGEISPSFDPYTLDYTLTLPVDKPCLAIEAASNDASATITGTGDHCKKDGENIIVTVTATNGETRDYTLKVVRPASDNDTLADLQIDGATINGYDPATKTYQIEINDHTVREVEISYEKSNYYQTTAPDSSYKVAIEPGVTTTDIIVTSEDGSKTSTYTIIFTQPLTTKLMSLSLDGGLVSNFSPDTMNYSTAILGGTISVKIDAVPFDSNAAITVLGAGYIPANGGIVTVKVSREGVEDSIYTINITKESEENMQTVYNYPYKGSVQMFIAPVSSEYSLEAWGSAGGYGHQNSTKRAGGKGAYTSGKIFLNQGDVIYIYTGGVGANARSCGIYCGGAGGWNGGAKGGNDTNHDSQPDSAGGGGGATDFRLGTTLHSRIMVAGAGAGGSYDYLGRPGNALSGDGSSQISGYSFGAGQTGKAGTGGSGGGAGGYWGGTSVQSDSGQGYGGSSFVSGHLGAVAISSASSTTPRLASDGETVCTPALAVTDEKCAEHYSGRVFNTTVIKSGAESFPSPTGANETGHAGNGHARITMIVPPSNDNTLAELSFTNSTLSPSYDPAAPEGTPYTLSVPAEQTIINTKAVANHKKAVVAGDGEETILPANTPTEIIVSVTSESGLVRDYVTTATRAASANNKPTMLTMGSIPSGLCKNNGEYAEYSCRFNDSNNNAVFFDPNVTDYHINVPTVSNKLNFTVAKGHLFQEISAEVDGGVCTIDNENPTETGLINCERLPMGDNEIKITITAETGAKTTYTLHVFRTPGADVENIEVVDTPDEDADILHFNPLATDYGVTGLPDTEKVKFEVTVDDEVDIQVKFGENGNFEPCEMGDNGKPVCEVEGLELKKNDIWIQATLNGMVKTYYINWYRQLSSNTFLEYLTVHNAQDIDEEYLLSPSFEKTQEVYTAYVPFSTTQVLIAAEAERPDVSTVRGDTGVKSVTVGNNKFVIRVQAQDGSEGEYTLNVIRRADPNATVANVETNVPFTPNFDSETQNYIMDLDPHFNSIDFTKIEMESDVATYEIIGNSGLMPGVSEVIVRGVAADGTTKDYTFVVNMEPSSNTDLASLQAVCNPYQGETLSSAVNCQLVPDFNAEETEYSMTVPGEVDTVTLSGTPADELSTVSGLGKFTLATGTNEFDITVTAQDGSERIVTVTIERTEDNNNLLKSWALKSGAESVDFGFEPTKNNYTVTVENEISQLAVTALPLRNASQVALGTNSPWKLDVGENEFTVTVIAENGETNEYTIEITRKPSSNVCLSRLTLQEAKISPAFSCNTASYTAEVPYWITKATPIYTTAEPNATVEVTDNEDLQVGDNEVKIIITAEDGTTTKEYTVVVNRHEDTEFSSRLVNLWTDIGDWNKPFEPEALYYEVDVASTVNQVKVGGLVEDIDGPATVDGLGTHTLKTGENIIQVVVTATDDSTTTYTLNVKRAPSTDASLKSLLLGRGSFAPSFKPDVLMYTMTADEGFVDFTALPRHDGATVKDADGNGKIRYPLEVGENTIDIEVTAEDGVTKKVYTVIVTRLVGINAQLSQLRVGDNMPLTPSFKESTSTYTVSNVSPTTDKINVYAKTRDSDSKVKISGGEYQVGETTSEVELDYGTNHIVVDVTAANGINTMQYVVTVIRNISGNNNLANLIPSIGTLSPSFSAGTMSYTLNVDYMTKQLNLEAIVQHENAHISYMAGAGYSASQNRKSVTRTINLTNEVTTVTVTVTAANGAAKSYTVQIRRNQNYPSTLDNLKVTPYDLDEVFNSTKLNYTVEVDYEIDAVAKLPINAIKSDPNATVTIGGGALSIGPNTVPITVVSRDGKSTTTYNLTVIRRSYSNNFLTYISTNQSTEIEPDFDKYNLSYSMTVGNTVSSISLSAEPENYNSSVKIGNASFTGQNAAYTWPVALNYGENVINITVTTSTNVKRVYKLTVTRELATSTDLSNVSFKAGSQSLEICDASETLDPETMSCAFTPAFSNEVDNYTVHVPAGTARGEINVTPANSLATVIGGGVVDLVAGHNEFTVTVRAQDGNEREITVDFVREALDINRIIELHVVPGAESGTSIEPNFTYDYDATAESPYIVRIPGRVSMIGFDVQLEDSLYSTVRGIESAPVPDGESTRQIVVKAENGDERVYNILLIKTPLDTNNFLDDLAVDGATVPGFNPTEKFYYDMGVVPNSKDKVEISALVTEPAKILPGGTGEIELASGDNNIQIRVQAENDEIRTYTVHIYRTPNDDNTLINIVIPKHTLTNPFKQYNTTYYVITSNKTTHASLNIQPILSSPNDASYKIEYMQPEFEVGSNLVKIIVTAENGDQMTYYIYVVLQNIDENYHLESLNTDIYELMEPTDPDAVAFSPTTFEYSFSVPMSQDRICVTARAESIQATILGAQDLANSTAVEVCYDLDVGINNIPVMVTAGNGVVKEYMLNVTREGTAGISKIVAVPEKRIPGKGNNNTWFLIEVVPAGQPYYKADNSGTNVVWDNKADILGGAKHHTNDHGVWNSSENGGVMPVAVAGGEYDVYFTGYSHLSKKKSNVKFLDGEPIEINFTYDEDTLADMMTAGTLSSDDPMYPLLAGDAGAASDNDLSCGPVIADCVTGGMFSGDEWGDDLVNSLDTSAILTKLYANRENTQKSLTDISKEDLDGNGQINSLDMSTTLNNLFRRGDKQRE